MMDEFLSHSSSGYNDSYPTCERTYATLIIILPITIDPEEISSRLQIIPSKVHRKGEFRAGKVKNWPNAWFLTTNKVIESKDVRRHIDWLLTQLEGKDEIILQVQAEFGKVIVSCFWESHSGYGGPMLPPKMMGKLGQLGIELWFDVFFVGNDDKN